MAKRKAPAEASSPEVKQPAAAKKTKTTPKAKTTAKEKSTTVRSTPKATSTKMPSRYTQQQERSLVEFGQVTQADKTTSAKILKQNGWNMSQAINSFFNSGTPAASPGRSKIVQIFDKYRDDPKELPDEINFDGVSKFLEDIDIGVEDIGTLALFEIVQSPQLGRITRDGFIEGFSTPNADSTAKMRNYVLARRSQLSTDRSIFKSVYNHTFTLLIEGAKKSIELEQAAAFWKILFSDDGFEWNSAATPWLDWYLEYLTTKWNKAVNKDLWRQTLAFAEASKADATLSFWNEESSWPSVIDDFVGWVKAEKGISSDAMDTED